MREGEIVRIDDQICRVDRVDHELIRIGDDFRNVEAAEIVTVAELFAAAGHPVPDHCALWCQTFSDIDGESDVQWGWNGSALSAVFAGGRWSRPGRETIPNPIDLSRLPALDAWDALPSVVKSIVRGES